MTPLSKASYAAALAAGALMVLSGCGGSGSAAAPKTDKALLGEKLTRMVAQVDKMGIVEWQGQLLTKNPDKGGKRILDLTARYSPSTGYSEISMETTMNGSAEQVDYLVINDRTYFNSETWGPGANECWADITGDDARSWGLPDVLDPKWALTTGRALSADGDNVNVAISFKDVLAGLPRGLFPEVPSVPYDTEATALIEPHGRLVSVGVDVFGMWGGLPKKTRSTIDTGRAGWWAMTMKEAPNGQSIEPPVYVFDPKITPPSQCRR